MPTTNSANQALHEAPFPFNKSQADIVLRSSDWVDFRVRSHILVEVSAVFEATLSLPQPQASSDPNGSPIIDLAEDSSILEALLRICYPIEKDETPRSLANVELVLRAALKYDMPLPIAVLKKELIATAKSAPIPTWAVACHTGLEEVARHAAEITLALKKDQLVFSPSDLTGVSAADYFRLCKFHCLGGKVEPEFWLLSPVPASSSQTADVPPPQLPSDIPFPDLIVRSSDGVDFALHRGVISMASQDLCHRIQALVEASSGANEMPVLQLQENSAVLAVLLRMCYSGVRAVQLNLDFDYEAILTAAEVYGMDCIRIQILNMWREIITTSPLCLYFIAVRLDWKEGMKQAAAIMLSMPLYAMYISQMEIASAIAYHRLIAYHGGYITAVTNSLESITSHSNFHSFLEGHFSTVASAAAPPP